MKAITTSIYKSVLFLVLMTVITGGLYPLTVTLVAKLAFPSQAEGSLIRIKDEIKGSSLIGQEYKGDKFFHGRPSCASYDPLASGASNLSVTSAALNAEVAKRKVEWQKSFGEGRVPQEMLYASASGLDPEISRDAALAQLEQVSQRRGYNQEQKNKLREYINREANAKGIALLPMSRVNVVKLNLFLEEDRALNGLGKSLGEQIESSGSKN